MQIKIFTLFVALSLFNGLLQTSSAPAGGSTSPRARPASPVRQSSTHGSGQQSAQHHTPIVKDKDFHKAAAASAKADAQGYGTWTKGVAKTTAKGLSEGHYKDAAAGAAMTCMLGAACGARKVSQIYHNVRSNSP